MQKHKKSISRILLAGLTQIILFTPLMAGQLQDVEVVSLSDNTTEVRFLLNDIAPQPLSFTIDSPARIALDLPDTSIGSMPRRKAVDIGNLQSILAAEANGRTRLVLNLDSMTPYQTRTEGNTVILTLGLGSSDYSSSFTSEAVINDEYAQDEYVETPSSPTASGPYIAGDGDINAVDFKRGSDGAGQVVIKLSDPTTKVDISEEAGKIVATFKNTNIPVRLQRRMDVVDFGTPINNVDMMARNNDVRLLISARGDYDQLVYQSEDTFTIEVKEKIEVTKDLSDYTAMQDRVYTGTPINLNFQSIDVRAVLQLLASNGDFNIVVSDTVTGNVTLRLQNVPWDQALDIVLQSKGLDKRTKDNVVMVAPAIEIAEQEQQQLQAIKDLEQLAPLRSDIVQINYAKAADIKMLLEEGQGVDEEELTQSFLSSRGSVTTDERTNTLLIYDTVEKLVEIRELVKILDVPVTQVLIESRVVVANTDFSREIGVRAGFTSVYDNSADGLISVSGTASGANNTLSNAQSVPAGSPFAFANQNERLNVNLPVAGSAGSIGLAILNGDYLIDLELSALQAEGRGEIISSPRVTATNQKEAMILQGVQIPYIENTGDGTITTSFKDAVLRMTVTPLITPDGYIIMDLNIAQDGIGAEVSTATGTIPSIDTRQLDTQVRIKDGETAVLGGIYETEQRNTETKVPILGDIPLIGGMFKNSIRSDDKTEMLIFITPKILHDDNLDY